VALPQRAEIVCRECPGGFLGMDLHLLTLADQITWVNAQVDEQSNGCILTIYFFSRFQRALKIKYIESKKRRE
jgi:hypothetical protein